MNWYMEFNNDTNFGLDRLWFYWKTNANVVEIWEEDSEGTEKICFDISSVFIESVCRKRGSESQVCSRGKQNTDSTCAHPHSPMSAIGFHSHCILSAPSKSTIAAISSANFNKPKQNPHKFENILIHEWTQFRNRNTALEMGKSVSDSFPKSPNTSFVICFWFISNVLVNPVYGIAANRFKLLCIDGTVFKKNKYCMQNT